MSMIRFVVYGEAQSKGSMRAFLPKGRKFPIVTSTNKGLKAWEDAVRAAAQTVATDKLMAGAISLTVTFWFTRPKSLPKKITRHTRRPDTDKLIRGCTDALTKVLWVDDAQLVSIHAEKRYTATDRDTPKAEFVIENLEPDLLEAHEEPLGDGEITFDY